MSYKTPYRLFRLSHTVKQWLNRRFTVIRKAIIASFSTVVIGISDRFFSEMGAIF